MAARQKTVIYRAFLANSGGSAVLPGKVPESTPEY
jgi:hypothetical protein